METPAPGPLKQGDLVVGRYRVDAELGWGGMGTVFRVEHLAMAKPMALKLLRPELSGVREIADRFIREARSMARLDDVHIARVTDFGETEDGLRFLVMELLEGVTLSAKIREEAPLPVDAAIEIVDQILAGLEHAHGHDIIHRDLKPDNIMLVRRGSREIVKILDFGLAKITDQPTEGDRPLTQAGVVFGTPKYMSPEQAGGEVADHRSDLYAVGVILHELLTGKPPFRGESTLELLRAHLVEPVPPLALSLPDRSQAEALEHVVQTALAKHREERFNDAAAFRRDLSACTTLSDTGAHTGTSTGTGTGIDANVDPTRVRLLRSGSFRTESLRSIPNAPSSTPPRPPKRLSRGLRIASVAAVALASILAVSLVLTRKTPEEQIERAIDRGDLKEARSIVDRLIAKTPNSARVHLLAGHVAFAAKDFSGAVESYGVALASDGALAGDPRLIAHARRLMTDEEGTGFMLLRLIEEKGDASAVPLLAEMATESQNARVRRRALQGLDRRGRLDLVDALTILLRDLRDTADEPCSLRQWYLEQIVKLPQAGADPRVLPALRFESARTGPLPFGLSRVNRCMERWLRQEIKKREGPATKEGGPPAAKGR